MPEDGKRYELIDGEIFMTPSPNRKHQKAVGNIYMALREYVDARGLGEVYVAPFDVVFGEHDAVQPDVLIVSRDRLGIITPLFVYGAPDLVVEVLSPSNIRFDRERKRSAYATAGVKELWYIDPKTETAEILNLGSDGDYRLTHSVCAEELILSETLPGFSLPLRRVFA